MPNRANLELLQHSDFVRRLARHLLGDVEAADDVAQDALLVAIERPPRDSDRLKSWLGSVTRRLAFRHLRDQGRRRRGLDSLEAPAEPESPDSIADRRAVLGSVTAAVQGLDDVYFEAVQLRYFEGLTPTEIAKRLNVPLATVSSRLQRALAKLRGRLENDAGPRWRAGLAAAVGLPSSLDKVSTSTTYDKLLWSLTMSQAALVKTTAVVTLSAAVLFFGGSLLFPSSPSAAPQVGSAGRTDTSADVSVESEHAAGVVGAQVTRESLDAGTATAPPSIRLVAALQWTDGSPARAVRAMLRGANGSWTVPVVVGAEGSMAEFPGLSPGAYELRIAGSSIEHSLELGTGPVERRTVELTPVTEFRGRVSAADGAPVAGAWILGGGVDVLAVSDARGRFRVRSLANVRTFSGRARGYAASRYLPVPGVAEEAHVVLTPGGAVLEGQVTDPNGEPVASADVMVGRPYTGDSIVTADGTRVHQIDRVRVRTDATGQFVAVGLRPGAVPLRVPANGDEWSDWNQEIQLEADTARFVPIRLERPCSVVGQVRDGGGAPAGGARVVVRWGAEIDQEDRVYADEGGRFRLQNLPPGPVVLTAELGGSGQCRERIVLESDRESEWRPFLELGTLGRVVDAKGEPVRGARILAEAPSFDVSVTSDENGAFSIRDCPDTLTSLYVIAGQSRILGHWSDYSVYQRGLFLRLAPNAGLPCQIAVRVLGPEGRPVDDARLSLGEPGQPARIGSGPPDEDGWIRLSGPIYGVRFAAKIRSKALGTVSLGVRSPDAEGLLDFGTVRLQEPGRLTLQVRPDQLRLRVERFVIETLEGGEIVGAAGLPAPGLRMAPGEYRVSLFGDGIAAGTRSVMVVSGELTEASLELSQPEPRSRGRR